jgi:HEAT repeat protein
MRKLTTPLKPAMHRLLKGNAMPAKLRLLFTGLMPTMATLMMLSAAQSPAKAIDCTDDAAIREHLIRNAQTASQRDREPLECSAAAIAPLTSIIEVETDRPLRLAALAALGRIGFEMQLDETANLSALQATPPFLLAIIQDPSEDERIRQGAACALGSTSTDNDLVVSQLLDIFETESDLDFQQTLLGTIGSLIDRQQLNYCAVSTSGGRRGISTDYERDISDQTINSVVITLTRLLEQPEAKVFDIEAGSDEYDWEIQQVYGTALEILGDLGEAAVPAVPAMFGIRGFFVASDASEVIAQIGAPALPILLDYYESPPSDDPDVRDFQRARVLDIVGDMENVSVDQVFPLYLEVLQSPTSTQTQKNVVLGNLSRPGLDLAISELLPVYLEMLRSGESVSTELIAAISALGPAASEAVPGLMQSLETSEDLQVKRTIVRALPQFGPAATEAIPELLALLDTSADASLKSMVIQTLSQFDEVAATRVIPALAEVLKTAPEPDVREAAATALGRIAADGINPQLANLNEEEREVAEAVLSAFTGDTFTLPDDPPIAANLNLPNLDIAIEALYQAFEQDPEVTVTLAAARSLSAIGVSHSAFASTLLARAEAAVTAVNASEADESPFDNVESGFINVLADVFRKSQDPRLLGADQNEINDTLMRLVRFVEQGNCEAVSTLEAALKLAPPPSAAVTDALVGAVNRDLCPGQGLALILSEIEITSESTAILSPMIDLAAQGDFNAIFALGSIGSDAEVAVPTLIQVAQTSTDWTSRSGAIHALGRIGTPNPDAIRFLQENLRDPSAADTHAVSALSLGLIGAPAQNALPTLVERLESVVTQADDPDFDSYIPEYSANAIASIIQDILLLSPELPQDERAQLSQYIERSLTAIEALPPEFGRLKDPLQEALAATSS